MINTFPSELTDVDQAVDTAQIDKRPKVLQAPHNAITRLTDFECFPQLLFFFSLLAFQDRSAAENEIAFGESNSGLRTLPHVGLRY